jgi:uncharacterized protein YjhX (UPF0386 family)
MVTTEVALQFIQGAEKGNVRNNLLKGWSYPEVTVNVFLIIKKKDFQVIVNL